MPGWWFVEEHVARILARGGRNDAAIERYARIVEVTDRVEPMVALARLLRERGDGAAADRWEARAHERTHEIARRFPEVARGHGHHHAAQPTMATRSTVEP